MKLSLVLGSATLLLGALSPAFLARAGQVGMATYLSQVPSGITYTTVRNDGGIDMQITDGNFRWHGTLRPGENAYVGVDGIAAVNLTPSTGHVVVYSTETGETFYDYYIEPVNLGGGHTQRTPTTYLTPLNANEIAIQISDGNFVFHDVLYRYYGNHFQASDHGYRVMYDRDSGRVTVINEATGVEFYNYFYIESHGRSGYHSLTPVTYVTPRSADQIDMQITAGEFRFHGPLTRSSGNTFTGADGRVRVIYDRDTGRIVVLNVMTGSELYNYVFSEVNEGYL
jgi:hypothetical protein